MAVSISRTIVAVLILTTTATAGCVSTPKDLKPKPDEQLVGTSWQLGKLGGESVLEDAQPTLQFTQNGQVAGSGSCNRFSGTVTLSGDTIAFGPLASTRMACADPINAQEADYFKALGAAERFVVLGDSLQIYTSIMAQPLLFIRTNPH